MGGHESILWTSMTSMIFIYQSKEKSEKKEIRGVFGVVGAQKIELIIDNSKKVGENGEK